MLIPIEARRTGRRNFVKWTEEVTTHFLAKISLWRVERYSYDLYIGVVMYFKKSKPTPTLHPSNEKYVTFYRLK
jgi:hypothetical protein